MASFELPHDHGTLTTDHAASSHGVPVLILGGRPHGPADRVPGLDDYLHARPDAQTAGQVVAALFNRRVTPDRPRRSPIGMKFSEATRVEFSAEAVELARRFCAADPSGPQVL
jgi:hypothetical protein